MDDASPDNPEEAVERKRYRVHLCFGPHCTPRGGRSLLPVLEAAVARAGIGDRVEVVVATCRNRCDYGPSMNVYPGPTFYNGLTAEAVEEIVEEHLLRGRPAARWFFRPTPIRATQGSARPRR